MSGPPIPVPKESDRPATPSMAEASGRIMVRHLASALRGRKAAMAGLLGALPVVVALAMRSTDPVVVSRVVSILHLLLVLPILAVSLGTGLFYDEAEEGTLTFLWVTPIPRAAVVFGKWAAMLLLGGAVLFSSLGLTLLVTPAPEGQSAEAFQAFSRASFEALALGYPAYLGFYVLLGSLFRQGLIAGLLYFVYEFVVARIPAAFKFASLRYYVDSLVYPAALDSDVFMGEFENFPAAGHSTCAAVLFGAAVVGVAGTVVLAQFKEFQARNVQG